MNLMRMKQGKTSKVYYNSQGMPVCIFDRADSHNGVLLLWKAHNPYGRPVYAQMLSDNSLYTKINYFDRGCSNWEWFSYDLKIDQTWFMSLTPLPAAATSYNGISIPPKVLANLRLIRRGMNENIGDETAAQYLSQHPLPYFNIQINRQLTRSIVKTKVVFQPPRRYGGQDCGVFSGNAM